MDAQITINSANLKIFRPDQASFNFGTSEKPTTPNEWFAQKYPEQIKKFGSPFLELNQAKDQFTVQILPVSINLDFFAGILGGRKDLGHHVIYFQPEMDWYFLDADGMYKPTTAEKLGNLYRALLMKCAGEMSGNVHLQNLFHEYRSDRVSKAVVQRAKSILQADASYFSAESKNQRIRGIELHERIARKFVDELLTAAPGNVLLLADAYTAFLNLMKQNSLEPLKRSDFKAMVVPFVQEKFAVSLRNDLKIDERSGVRGWKNVKIQTMPG